VKFIGPEATVGSGPYKLEKYNAATGEYAFQANENYFLGVPYVRRLEFVQAPNQLLALGPGGLDLASPGTEEGYRISGYNNPAFDDAASRQLLATTDEQRKAAVADMQPIVAEDVPLISLYIPNRIQLCNTSLFDAWYFTPGGVFGGYPGVLNKHVFVTGKQAGF
jgi:ABC-type transport system substrate-binding protein